VLIDAPQAFGPRVSNAVYMSHSSPPRLLLSVGSTVVSLMPLAFCQIPRDPIAQSWLGTQQSQQSELWCELLTTEVSERLILVPHDEPTTPRVLVLSDHIMGGTADVLDVVGAPRRCGVLALRSEQRRRGPECDEYIESGAFLPDGRIAVAGRQMRDDGPRAMLGGRYYDDSLSEHGICRVYFCASVHGIGFSGESSFFERAAAPLPSGAQPPRVATNSRSRVRTDEEELLDQLPSMSDTEVSPISPSLTLARADGRNARPTTARSPTATMKSSRVRRLRMLCPRRSHGACWRRRTPRHAHGAAPS
jgi:hypothetical protein